MGMPRSVISEAYSCTPMKQMITKAGASSGRPTHITSSAPAKIARAVRMRVRCREALERVVGWPARSASEPGASELATDERLGAAPFTLRSYRQDVGLFRLGALVDLVRELVGELLHLGLAASQLVLAQLAFLLHELELIVGVAADVPDRDLGLLGHLVDGLHQVAAPLVGEGRHADEDAIA